MNYQKKYLKYKAKYFQQKVQSGGANQTVKVKTPKGEIISFDMGLGATIRDLKNLLSFRSENIVPFDQFNIIRDGVVYNDDKSISEILASPGSPVFMVRVLQIQDTDPLVAYQTLKRFGFEKYLADDGLYNIWTVDQWFKNYVEKNMPGEVEELRENTKWINYLNLLTSIINSNRDIINRDDVVVETVPSSATLSRMPLVKIGSKLDISL